MNKSAADTMSESDISNMNSVPISGEIRKPIKLAISISSQRRGFRGSITRGYLCEDVFSRLWILFGLFGSAYRSQLTFGSFVSESASTRHNRRKLHLCAQSHLV